MGYSSSPPPPPPPSSLPPPPPPPPPFFLQSVLQPLVSFALLKGGVFLLPNVAVKVLS